MTKFEKALEFVLAHEGGLSENPSDSGGVTNFGISLRFLREVLPEKLRRYGIFGDVNEETIRHLTPGQAKLIYHEEFWECNRFDEIFPQDLCAYCFDMVVNHGAAQAIKLIQRATWAYHFTRYYIREDGVIGNETLDALNGIGDDLLPVLVGIRAEFFRHLSAIRPKDEHNLDGWLNRAYSAK